MERVVRKNINNESTSNTNNNNNTNFTEVTDSNNTQVSTIISTINRIKYTKQIYNNRKKLFNESKMRQKKLKYSNKGSMSNSRLYYRPSYSKLRMKKNNDINFYKRSNSKNVMNNRSKNLNLNYMNFNKSKNNLANDSLEVMSVDNLNNSFNNGLMLSFQNNKNKYQMNKSYRIKENSANNLRNGIKSLNTSFNSKKSNNFNIND